MTSLDRIFEGMPLDESAWIAVGDLCAWLRVEPHWVVSLVDAGVLEPRGAGPEAWLFPASDVVRVRAVARLLRDLDVNLEGAALILELVEERRRLERRIALLERLLEE